MERAQNQVTLNLYGRDMGSAHCLDEVNNWSKFNENPSSRLGDIEWTQFGIDRPTDIQDKNNKSPLYTGRDIIMNRYTSTYFSPIVISIQNLLSIVSVARRTHDFNTTDSPVGCYKYMVYKTRQLDPLYLYSNGNILPNKIYVFINYTK